MSVHGNGNGILKARPMGRAAVSEVIAGLAARANELKLQARWAATQVVVEGDDSAAELVKDSLACLADASDSLLDLAIGVKLGTFSLRPLPYDAQARPLLDQVEERAGRQEPAADPVAAITGAPPVRPRPSPSRTFEVLDRGRGHPGHVHFAAADEAEAIAKGEESWPGLEVAEIAEPAKVVANHKGDESDRPVEVTEGIEDGPRATDGAEAVASAGSKALAPDEFQPLDPVVGRDPPMTDRVPSLREVLDCPDHGAPKANPPAKKLSTDELLHLACHRREGMADRWESMARDGATDLEMRAALSRAFDLGRCDMYGGKGGTIVEDGGSCSFLSGDSPKFWADAERSGRPTLEGKRLVERARVVLKIPETAGGPLPKAQSKRKKPKLFDGGNS